MSALPLHLMTLSVNGVQLYYRLSHTENVEWLERASRVLEDMLKSPHGLEIGEQPVRLSTEEVRS